MTGTLFAPPELFSAYVFAEDGSGLDIPKGPHLRIFAGPGASFPLAPFAVFKLADRTQSRMACMLLTVKASTNRPGSSCRRSGRVRLR